MKRKRYTAALLALLMLLALTGCGEKEDTAPDTGTQTPAPAPTPEPTPTPTPDPTPAPDPEPNVPAQPDAPVLPTPVVSGGDLQPIPGDPAGSGSGAQDDIRPEIRNDIDAIRATAETALLYIAQYNSYDPETQKAEEQLMGQNIDLVMEMHNALAQIGTMELSDAERQYLMDADVIVWSLMEPWLPLIDSWLTPPAPSYTLPQSMTDKIAALEQMYADSYTFLSTGAAAIYGRITDYASYQYNHEALMGFFDMVFSRCVLQDPDTLIQTAIAYYQEAAQLTGEERDYAMKQFYDRVLDARVGCIDRFYAQEFTAAYYDSCYIHFVTDAWQGSTPPDEWAAAKIAAQDEFYNISNSLLAATDVREFHQNVLDGFARGDFDVYNLMAVKN